jgi:hypothetical protein
MGKNVKPSTSVADGYVGGVTATDSVSSIEARSGIVRFLTGASQAITEDSAITITERMRIDSAGNVGIGTSSPTSPLGSNYKVLDVNSGVWGGTINFSGNNGGFIGNRHSGNSGLGYYAVSGRGHTFYTGGASATFLATLDSSGNLGIGTTSPGFKLDVVGNAGIARIQSTGAGQNAQLNLQSTTATWSIGQNITLASTGTLEFYNGSTRLQLDSSGNLGLGVTPSAWGGYKAIQVNEASLAATTGSNTALTSNGYFDGTNWKYIYSNYATRYLMTSGQHQWGIAPSGTAGNAISFTQAMTLNASGQLLVGTTTAASRVTVNLSGAYDGITLRTTNEGPIGLFGMVAPGTNNDIAIGTLGANNLRFFANGTANERARIDTNGRLLVGLTSATGVAKLQVSGPIQTTGYTVATLPAGTVGMRTYVTDALAPSFGVTVSGGGAVTIPVFYDGANWIVA